jgi:hypothetical protein
MKIFLAAYSGDPALTDRAVEELFREFRGGVLGTPDVQSPDMPMPCESYYAPEMGAGLLKRYLSSPTRLEPGALVDLKLLSMEVESRRRFPSGGRMVNLDPGYLSLGGLVLSTGKFAGHRLWLGRGIWGELTLAYRNGGFRPLPWTYLDYRDPTVLRHLTAMRRLLVASLREDRKSGDGTGPGSGEEPAAGNGAGAGSGAGTPPPPSGARAGRAAAPPGGADPGAGDTDMPGSSGGARAPAGAARSAGPRPAARQALGQANDRTGRDR